MIFNDRIFFILAPVSLYMQVFMKKKKQLINDAFFSSDVKLSDSEPDADRELRNYLQRQEFALHLRNANVISEILSAECASAREGRFRSCVLVCVCV